MKQLKKQLKPKKCRVTTCRELFVPRSGLQVVCHIRPGDRYEDHCAVMYEAQKAAEKAAKKLRGERKVFRDNDRAIQLGLAQDEINAWVRKVRDRNEPCISCGRHHNGQYHGGHYRSVGATKGLMLDGVPLRYHEDNIQKQCSCCNNHKSSNSIEYRIRLVQKIGVDRVEAIENCHTMGKFSLEEIVAIKDKYKRLNKEAS